MGLTEGTWTQLALTQPVADITTKMAKQIRREQVFGAQVMVGILSRDGRLPSV